MADTGPGPVVATEHSQIDDFPSDQTLESVNLPLAGAGTTGTAGEAMAANLDESLNADLTSPSPLSGGYLLIVIAEPQSEEHKEVLLQRLTKGLLSWDNEDSHVDLERELLSVAQQALQGEEAKNGERLVQLASESLVTEILIHPQVNTLRQCIRNLLASFTRHRHIVHAGYTLSGSGAWLLQDGTFSAEDFLEAYGEPEVQRVLRAYKDIHLDLHCSPEGFWNSPNLVNLPNLQVRLNPADRLSSATPGFTAFGQYLSDILPAMGLDKLLEASDVVGNIRFSHPTLYVFPGGQGDAALFGINGFNILVDGGFGRKPCFWDFTRHLDRLDAVIMTRPSASTLSGLSRFVHRKSLSPVFPQIGHFFANLPSDGNQRSPDGDKDADPLLLHLLDMGQSLAQDLKTIQLTAQPLYRHANEPINLYHKVGHGTLDLYVVSPAPDCKEVKEFLRLWKSGESGALGGASNTIKLGGKDVQIPLTSLVSVCALLIWHPANPTEPLTRILFPGSAPQSKILAGLEKLRHLDCLKFSSCTPQMLANNQATENLPEKQPPKAAKSKSSVINAATGALGVEKSHAEPKRPSSARPLSEVIEVKQSKTVSSSTLAPVVKKEVKKEVKPKEEKKEPKVKEEKKEPKPKEDKEEKKEIKAKEEKKEVKAKEEKKDLAPKEEKKEKKIKVEKKEKEATKEKEKPKDKDVAEKILKSKVESRPASAKKEKVAKEENKDAPVAKKEAVVTPKTTPIPTKVKKEAANLKVVEAKVQSHKMTPVATPKRSESADKKEETPKKPRSQSRGPKDVKEEKKPIKLKEVKEATPSPKPKAKVEELPKKEKPKVEKKAVVEKKEVKPKVEKVKVDKVEKAKVEKVEKVEKKKETKPKAKPADKPKESKGTPVAKKSTATKAGSSQPVAIKKPAKVIAAAAAAAAVAAGAVSALAQPDDTPEVVEEAIVAAQAAPAAAAAPKATETEVISATADLDDFAAAIEDQILGATILGGAVEQVQCLQEEREAQAAEVEVQEDKLASEDVEEEREDQEDKVVSEDAEEEEAESKVEEAETEVEAEEAPATADDADDELEAEIETEDIKVAAEGGDDEAEEVEEAEVEVEKTDEVAVEDEEEVLETEVTEETGEEEETEVEIEEKTDVTKDDVEDGDMTKAEVVDGEDAKEDEGMVEDDIEDRETEVEAEVEELSGKETDFDVDKDRDEAEEGEVDVEDEDKEHDESAALEDDEEKGDDEKEPVVEEVQVALESQPQESSPVSDEGVDMKEEMEVVELPAMKLDLLSKVEEAVSDLKGVLDDALEKKKHQEPEALEVTLVESETSPKAASEAASPIPTTQDEPESSEVAEVVAKSPEISLPITPRPETELPAEVVTDKSAELSPLMDEQKKIVTEQSPLPSPKAEVEEKSDSRSEKHLELTPEISEEVTMQKSPADLDAKSSKTEGEAKTAELVAESVESLQAESPVTLKATLNAELSTDHKLASPESPDVPSQEEPRKIEESVVDSQHKDVVAGSRKTPEKEDAMSGHESVVDDQAKEDVSAESSEQDQILEAPVVHMDRVSSPILMEVPAGQDSREFQVESPVKEESLAHEETVRIQRELISAMETEPQSDDIEVLSESKDASPLQSVAQGLAQDKVMQEILAAPEEYSVTPQTHVQDLPDLVSTPKSEPGSPAQEQESLSSSKLDQESPKIEATWIEKQLHEGSVPHSKVESPEEEIVEEIFEAQIITKSKAELPVDKTPSPSFEASVLKSKPESPAQEEILEEIIEAHIVAKKTEPLEEPEEIIEEVVQAHSAVKDASALELPLSRHAEMEELEVVEEIVQAKTTAAPVSSGFSTSSFFGGLFGKKSAPPPAPAPVVAAPAPAKSDFSFGFGGIAKSFDKQISQVQSSLQSSLDSIKTSAIESAQVVQTAAERQVATKIEEAIQGVQQQAQLADQKIAAVTTDVKDSIATSITETIQGTKSVVDAEVQAAQRVQTDIETQVQATIAKVADSVQGKIDSITQRASTAEQEVDETVQAAQTTFQSQAEVAKSTLEKLEAEFNDSLGDIESQIEAVEAKITETVAKTAAAAEDKRKDSTARVRGEFDDLEAQIESKVDLAKTELETIQKSTESRIAELQDDIESGIVSTVDQTKTELELIQKSGKSKVEELVDDLESQIETLESQKEHLASAVESIAQEIQDEKNRISEQAMGVTESVKESTHAQSESVIESAQISQSVLESIESQVEEAAEIVSGQITDLQTDVQQHTEQLEESASEIKSTFLDSVQDKMDQNDPVEEELHKIEASVDSQVKRAVDAARDLSDSLYDSTEKIQEKITSTSDEIESRSVDVKENLNDALQESFASAEIVSDSLSKAVSAVKDFVDSTLESVDDQVQLSAEKIATQIEESADSQVEDIKEAVKGVKEPLTSHADEEITKIQDQTQGVIDKLSPEASELGQKAPELHELTKSVMAAVDAIEAVESGLQDSLSEISPVVEKTSAVLAEKAVIVAERITDSVIDEVSSVAEAVKDQTKDSAQESADLTPEHLEEPLNPAKSSTSSAVESPSQELKGESESPLEASELSDVRDSFVDSKPKTLGLEPVNALESGAKTPEIEEEIPTPCKDVLESLELRSGTQPTTSALPTPHESKSQIASASPSSLPSHELAPESFAVRTNSHDFVLQATNESDSRKISESSDIQAASQIPSPLDKETVVHSFESTPLARESDSKSLKGVDAHKLSFPEGSKSPSPVPDGHADAESLGVSAEHDSHDSQIEPTQEVDFHTVSQSASSQALSKTPSPIPSGNHDCAVRTIEEPESHKLSQSGCSHPPAKSTSPVCSKEINREHLQHDSEVTSDSRRVSESESVLGGSHALSPLPIKESVFESLESVENALRDSSSKTTQDSDSIKLGESANSQAASKSPSPCKEPEFIADSQVPALHAVDSRKVSESESLHAFSKSPSPSPSKELLSLESQAEDHDSAFETCRATDSRKVSESESIIAVTKSPSPLPIKEVVVESLQLQDSQAKPSSGTGSRKVSESDSLTATSKSPSPLPSKEIVHYLPESHELELELPKSTDSHKMSESDSIPATSKSPSPLPGKDVLPESPESHKSELQTPKETDSPKITESDSLTTASKSPSPLPSKEIVKESQDSHDSELELPQETQEAASPKISESESLLVSKAPSPLPSTELVLESQVSHESELKTSQDVDTCILGESDSLPAADNIPSPFSSQDVVMKSLESEDDTSKDHESRQISASESLEADLKSPGLPNKDIALEPPKPEIKTSKEPDSRKLRESDSLHADKSPSPTATKDIVLESPVFDEKRSKESDSRKTSESESLFAVDKSPSPIPSKGMALESLESHDSELKMSQEIDSSRTSKAASPTPSKELLFHDSKISDSSAASPEAFEAIDSIKVSESIRSPMVRETLSPTPELHKDPSSDSVHDSTHKPADLADFESIEQGQPQLQERVEAAPEKASALLTASSPSRPVADSVPLTPDSKLKEIEAAIELTGRKLLEDITPLVGSAISPPVSPMEKEIVTIPSPQHFSPPKPSSGYVVPTPDEVADLPVDEDDEEVQKSSILSATTPETSRAVSPTIAKGIKIDFEEDHLASPLALAKEIIDTSSQTDCTYVTSPQTEIVSEGKIPSPRVSPVPDVKVHAAVEVEEIDHVATQHREQVLSSVSTQEEAEPQSFDSQFSSRTYDKDSSMIPAFSSGPSSWETTEETTRKIATPTEDSFHQPDSIISGATDIATFADFREPHELPSGPSSHEIASHDAEMEDQLEILVQTTKTTELYSSSGRPSAYLSSMSFDQPKQASSLESVKRSTSTEDLDKRSLISGDFVAETLTGTTHKVVEAISPIHDVPKSEDHDSASQLPPLTPRSDISSTYEPAVENFNPFVTRDERWTHHPDEEIEEQTEEQRGSSKEAWFRTDQLLSPHESTVTYVETSEGSLGFRGAFSTSTNIEGIAADEDDEEEEAVMTATRPWERSEFHPESHMDEDWVRLRAEEYAASHPEDYEQYSGYYESESLESQPELQESSSKYTSRVIETTDPLTESRVITTTTTTTTRTLYREVDAHDNSTGGVAERHDFQNGNGHRSETATSVTEENQSTAINRNGHHAEDRRVSPEEKVASWGKPLGLPAPVTTNGGMELETVSKSPLKDIKRSVTQASPQKRSKLANGSVPAGNTPAPIYVDLAYVPHHGHPDYCDADYFKRIRARHYVFSGLEPSPTVLQALLDAKMSWTGEDKDLDVTIIPTYDSDSLGMWVAAHEEQLAAHRIDLAPSASRCTINLQDHETSCSAYRLEF